MADERITEERSVAADLGIASGKAGESNGSAWNWIPTLYLAEGLPYFAVNVLTVMMYVQLGIDNVTMAFYTGALYLPWVVKPFWSPFVDIFSTKRKWAIAMQGLIAACMAATALLLGTGIFFAATLACFWIMAFASATHDIAADGYYMLQLNKEQQAAFVGLRSTFYRIASVIGQGGIVILVGIMQEKGIGITASWQSAFLLLAVIFAAIAIWHIRRMPTASADSPSKEKSAKEILHEFVQTYATFFLKPGVWGAILFLLLYRLPEAFCIKMITPFLLAPHEEGGLALSVEEVGIANGTIGVVALLAGGITGGLAIASGGLRKWLWPMAFSLTLPCLFYCFLAMYQPENFLITAAAIGIEQFGYGFGFTAFMMYMMYFARGKNSTSHYAYCTAFMALGMMLPGMAAGWVWQQLEKINIPGLSEPQGYVNFFWFVMLCSLATLAACLIVRKQLRGESTDQ